MCTNSTPGPFKFNLIWKVEELIVQIRILRNSTFN
jgi:hypothetical protein